MVLVKKANDKEKVHVDSIDLNKDCPKDYFPLPRIDQLVSTTVGNQLLSFMDAYSRYNQIPMHEPDQMKTIFIIVRGLYCYKVILFGLKNAGATYQQLVNKKFARLIGKTMDVYFNDMVDKSNELTDHVHHLREIFEILRRF